MGRPHSLQKVIDVHTSSLGEGVLALASLDRTARCLYRAFARCSAFNVRGNIPVRSHSANYGSFFVRKFSLRSSSYRLQDESSLLDMIRERS